MRVVPGGAPAAALGTADAAAREWARPAYEGDDVMWVCGLTALPLFAVLCPLRGTGKCLRYGKPVLHTLAFSFWFLRITPCAAAETISCPSHLIRATAAELVLESSGKIKHFVIYFPVVIPVHLSHEI